MASPRKLRDDPLWFKDAVFYEVYARGFCDSNADGIGDFRGLIEKLDYIEWLGVGCIWLLPVYSSQLRDGGYDIQTITRSCLSTETWKTSRSFSTPRTGGESG